MTTAQAATNGSRVSPPPSSAENPAEPHSADLSADKDHNKPFPAGAYHVPPNIYVPEARAYRDDEPRNSPHLPGPLPDRCQFMFSDGRQCTMARSDIHPSLCVYHSEREEQLFGDPFAESHIRGRVYDLPELFSAARDLSTAASVNRALAQVFRLLAQRRISRQEAATFAHLAKLLLRTISLMAAVSQIDDEPGVVIPSEYHERGIPSAVLPDRAYSRAPMRPSTGVVIPKTSSPTSEPTLADRAKSTIQPGSSSRATNWSEGSLRESVPAACSEPLTAPSASINSERISPSAPSACNSREICTYKNAEFNPLQNQHLQNRSERELCSSGRTANVSRRAT